MNTKLNFSKKIQSILSLFILMGMGFLSLKAQKITLEGDANGAAFPVPESYASRFTGQYAHHTLTGGIRHNLLQEAPKAFAEAIVEVDSMSQVR